MKKITKTKYKKLETTCAEAISENNITFLDEIFTFSDILPSEFYSTGLSESQKIKDLIEINRAKLKRELRLKWLDSTNATLNAALYKLVCTEEEKRALSAAAAAKTQQNNDQCTQEEYLKSLKEMGEGLVLNNTDEADEAVSSAD